MSPPPSKPTRADDKAGYFVAALVVGFSLVVGLFVLPYFGARRAEHSALAGKPAPDFILPFVSPNERGQSQRLSDLQGRAVVLDFWASWCHPCREQTPVLERVAASIGRERLTVLGIGTSDDQRAITDFLSAHPGKYPSVFDSEGTTSALYHVEGLPTLVVLAADGTVRAVVTGLVAEDELTRIVQDALK